MTINQTKEALSLKDIVQYELPALFKRHHLEREVVIGLIGLRGDGKSLGGSIIALLDNMLEGEPCWSNMKIGCVFNIDDSIAGKYGLKGGQVTFQAEKLDKEGLLRFDEKYADGLLFIDEINMEFAEARRSTSNVNLWFDRVGQQLRKRRLSMIYTVIHEMWVDWRIRDLTDIFIQCRDTALSPMGLAQKRKTGIDFEWNIFPMTRILTGESYMDTHRSLPPMYLHGRKFWGLIDTYELQAKGKYKYSVDIGKVQTNFSIEESQQVAEVRSKWGWLYDQILDLHSNQCSEILDTALWGYLQLEKRGVSSIAVGRQLRKMNISTKPGPKGHQIYIIDQFDLSLANTFDKKEAVLIS